VRSAARNAVVLIALGAVTARGTELRVGVAIERDRLFVAVDRASIEAPDIAVPLALDRDTVLVWLRPSGATSRTVYRIQVAALSDERAARREARKVARLVTPADAARDAERGTWRVRAGHFSSREEALLKAEKMLAGRYAGAFVVAEDEELARGAKAPGIRFALPGRDEVREFTGPIAIRPREGGSVEVDGIRYRGAIELSLGRKGLLQAINVVDLEDYLRGVVPKEMGPQQYPEVEALKAQAVAARTYALGSRNGFPDDGYDLCATARCQVYGGVAAEQPLTDRAVAETRGLVVAAEGRLIRAYFSATCGGHTEDVGNVFEGDPDAAWLKGVACAPEAALSARLPARASPPYSGHSSAGLLAAAGILDRDSLPAAAEAPAAPAVVIELARRAARFAGRGGAADELEAPVTARALWRYLVAAFDLDERARVLLTAADVLAYTRGTEADALSPADRRAAAVLALHGALPEFEDGQLHPEAPVSTAQVVAAIARLVEVLGAPLLEDAVLVRLDGDTLVTRAKGEQREERLLPGATFWRESGGRRVPFAGGLVLPGDSLRLVRRDGVAAVVVAESASAADDRRARDSRWTTVLTREEVETRFRETHAVGRLKDVSVARRGGSGRPVELELRGSEGTARVWGYAIKRLLGLKDDLFVIERIAAADGTATGFRFIGRGWGHGVGLCQEGAYGMALRGARFGDILGRYYPGTAVVQADSLGAAGNP
jgi:stage II sporulation protein D